MEFWQMAVLAPFYVMAVAATAIAVGTMLMYMIDAIRKQLQQ